MTSKTGILIKNKETARKKEASKKMREEKETEIWREAEVRRTINRLSKELRELKQDVQGLTSKKTNASRIPMADATYEIKLNEKVIAQVSACHGMSPNPYSGDPDFGYLPDQWDTEYVIVGFASHQWAKTAWNYRSIESLSEALADLIIEAKKK